MRSELLMMMKILVLEWLRLPVLLLLVMTMISVANLATTAMAKVIYLLATQRRKAASSGQA
jgi:hypothetical protein